MPKKMTTEDKIIALLVKERERIVTKIDRLQQQMNDLMDQADKLQQQIDDME